MKQITGRNSRFWRINQGLIQNCFARLEFLWAARAVNHPIHTSGRIATGGRNPRAHRLNPSELVVCTIYCLHLDLNVKLCFESIHMFKHGYMIHFAHTRARVWIIKKNKWKIIKMYFPNSVSYWGLQPRIAPVCTGAGAGSGSTRFRRRFRRFRRRSGRLWCRARSGSTGSAECFQRLASQHASDRFVKIKRCGCWGYHRSLFLKIKTNK